MEASNQPLAAAGPLSSGPRRARLYGALVFMVALSARLYYLSGVIESSPYYNVAYLKGTDPYNFYTWGLSILGDYGLGKGIYYQSPLYPYFLALVFKLTGGGNLIIPRLSQLVIGSFTAVLAFLLGRRIRGEAAGLVAGIIVSLYGPLIMYEAAFLRDGPITFLYTAFLYVLLSTRERPGGLRGLLLGALFGLCLLAKPNIIIMVPVMAWSLAKAGSASIPRWSAASKRMIAALALGFVLAMGPLWARNATVGAPFFALDKGGPLEYIAGNIPEAAPSGLEITPRVIEMSRAAQGSTLRAIMDVLKLYKDRPQEFVRLQFVKTWVFLNGFEVPGNMNYYLEKRYVSFLRLPLFTWSLLLGLAALGLFAQRREYKKWLELYLYLALMSLGTIAFFIVGRFKAPLVPVLAAFAGAGVTWVIGMMRERRLASAGMALIAAAAIVVATWARVPDPLRANDYQNMVRYYMMNKEPAKARQWAEEGKRKTAEIIAEGGGAEFHYRMARLEFLSGDPLAEVEAETRKAREAGAPAWLEPSLQDLELKTRERMNADDFKPGGFRFLGAADAGRDKIEDSR